EFQDARHQRFGDEAAAEVAEPAAFVGTGPQGVQQGLVHVVRAPPPLLSASGSEGHAAARRARKRAPCRHGAPIVPGSPRGPPMVAGLALVEHLAGLVLGAANGALDLAYAFLHGTLGPLQPAFDAIVVHLGPPEYR